MITSSYAPGTDNKGKGGDVLKAIERRLIYLGYTALAIYLCSGIIYSFILEPVVRFPDEGEYLKLSYHLLHGPGYSMDGEHLTACRPPGYAFFLCAIRAIGGDYFAFRLVQFFLLGTTAFLAYRLSPKKKMFAGLLIVVALVILYPVLFYTSGTLYPQTLSAFLFLLALNFLLAEPKSMFLDGCSGIIFGALILVVPTFLLTFIVVLGVASILKIMHWRNIVVIVFVAGLVVGTWTLRNALVFHHFVPVASNSGANFLIGNSEWAIPDEAASNVGIEPYYQQSVKLGLDEFQSDHFYAQAAWIWIENNPVKALTLYLKKVLNFFALVNVYATGNQTELSVWKQVVMAASYLFLLALLGWRLSDIKISPLLPREKLFLAVYILSAFTSAIFFTRIRHRLPYDYLIIVIVASHLSRRIEVWWSAKVMPKCEL